MAFFWILAGGATDIADGVIARRFDAATALGQVIDPLVDVCFNTCVFVGLYLGGLAPLWVLALVAVRYALVVFGAAWIYVTRGPIRIQPTVLGKFSGILIYALVAARIALAAYGSPELSARAARLLELGLLFLSGVAVIHVGVMGWTNVKLTTEQLEPPKVVANVSFKASSRRRGEPK